MPGPRNRPVRVALLGGLAVLLLGAAGCSGGADPGESGEPGGSSTPTDARTPGTGHTPSSEAPSPSGEYEPATSEGPAQNVPVPEMPEAATEPTEEGLEAALEYWWEAGDYLRETGDAGPFERISAKDCELCQSLISRWTEIYELNGWAETGPTSVDVTFVKMDPDGLGATGAMEVSEEPSQVYQPDGKPGGSGDGSASRPWAFSAVFDDEAEAWKLETLDPQGSPES